MPIKDYSTGRQPTAEEPAWDTQALKDEFEVLGFQAPFVRVRRRSDGAEGTLEFTHSPRVYFDFQVGKEREDRLTPEQIEEIRGRYR